MNYTASMLKRLRKEKRLSQTDLAKKMNVSAATISLWEAGRRTPTHGHIKKLCKIFNVSAEEILRPKREDELSSCKKVEEYKDALESKLGQEELAELGIRLFEEHTESMMESAVKIINSDETRKKQFLKELIGI